MAEPSMSTPITATIVDLSVPDVIRPRTQSPFSAVPEATPQPDPPSTSTLSVSGLAAFAATMDAEGRQERSGSLDGGGRSYLQPLPPLSAGASPSPAGSTTSLPQPGKKRPKKRGWKGYAMIYYDENGNVVEERPRDETPERDRPAGGSPAGGEYSHSRENTAPASLATSEPPLPIPSTSGALGVTLKRPAPTDVDPPKSARLPLEKGSSMSPVPRLISLPNTDPTSSKRSASGSAAPKKRRKTSPSTPHDTSRSNSVAPSRSKSKPLRPSGNTGVGTSRTIALAVAKEKEAANLSRGAGAPPPVPDDSPLPKMPRAGMGEALPFDAQESDLRNEASFIISSTDQRRAERAAAGIHEPPFDLSASTPSPPRPSRSNDNPYPTPRTAGPPNGTSRPPPNDEPEDFDTQFEKMQKYYEGTGKEKEPRPTGLERADDPRPPKWFPNQPSTVILAPPPGQVLPGRKGKEKFDKYERAQIDGLEGVADEHMENIKRFIDNVRDNVVTLVDHYFPNIGPKRDAMLEATGRQLADFGWELTDDADGALHPRRESDFSLYYAYARPFGGRH